MINSVRKLMPLPRGAGTAVLLAIGALLLGLLVGCASGATPAASKAASSAPRASAGGAVSQKAPPRKMTPNTPEVVRATDPGPYQGGGRLFVQEASFDYGKVKLEDWVDAVFTIRNVGDAPLSLNGEPVVRAVEGC